MDRVLGNTRRPFRQHRQPLHGFTLIELLVVVAIIVALLAILLPSLGKAVQLADRAREASDTRQFSLACLAYAADYRGALPRGGADANQHWSWTLTETWLTLEKTYGLQRQPFGCSSWSETNPTNYWYAISGDHMQVPWLYWGGRPYNASGYQTPVRVGTPATSNTLVTCYARDSFSSGVGWTQFSPHVGPTSEGLVTAGSVEYPEPDALAVGFLDASVIWTDFDDLETHTNVGTGTFYYAPNQ